MNRKIKIAIAEDHKVVRQGMLALFQERDDIQVVFDVANGVELIDQLKEVKPDVILLDLNMPIMNGHEALKVISSKYPMIRIIIVSMYSELDYIRRSITNGAHGFLQKETDFEKVIDAIYAVNKNDYYFDNVVTKELITGIRIDGIPPVKETNQLLNGKDIQIIRLVCEGKTNKEISEIVFLGVRTIEGRRQSISKKTGAKNIGDLVVYAIKHGIFRID